MEFNSSITKMPKLLECSFCKTTTTISSVNFPEDLYDLMVKHNLPQLLWICLTCKEKTEQNIFYWLSMADKQKELEKRIEDLSETVKEIQSVMNANNKDTSSFDKGIDPYLDNYSTISDFSKEGSIIDDDISTMSSLESIHSSPPCSLKISPSVQREAVTVLKEVQRLKIKIDPQEQKDSKKIVTDFLNKLVTVLKSDPTFNKLYQKPYYTGSSYEDLRISEASEYDINLVLKLPFQPNEIQVEFIEEIKSYAKVKIFNKSTDVALLPGDISHKVYSLFVENNYVIPEKVQRWLESVICKIPNINALIVDNVRKVSFRKNGPAKTVTLETMLSYNIDIDLVPVLEFKGWPENYSSSMLEKLGISDREQCWFLVAKEYQPAVGQVKLSGTENKCLWRIHFADTEKEILYNKGCVKPVIKLLKLLRDKQNWKILASYYLKTVVMWEVLKHPDSSYWKDDNVYPRLIEVLRSLAWYIKQRHIPYLFYPDFNLLAKMNERHAENIHSRLMRILRLIEKDIHEINNYI